MKLFVVFAVLLSTNVIVCDDEEEDENSVPSLCSNEIIDAADRLGNGSIRVYRGEYYWELEGLPNNPRAVGPFKVWYRNMLPIDRSTAISTVITGKPRNKDPHTEVTYKFKGRVWWSWKYDGSQKYGGTSGTGWDIIPSPGWIAMYNDGNLDKSKDYPMAVAFAPISVHYFNTISYPWALIGNYSGYDLKGQFGENFPSDVIAAVVLPSTAPTLDPKFKYYVYFFKNRKHCFRPINGSKKDKDCENKWRSNKELFGCSDKSPGPEEPDTAQSADPEPKTPLPPPDKGEGPDPPQQTDKPQSQSQTTTPTGLAVSVSNQNLKALLITLSFIISFVLIY